MRRTDRTRSAVKKPDLPTKTCAHCERPFTWRRKWALNWSEVRFCSDRCRRESRRKTARG
jgi:hypothetical protein